MESAEALVQAYGLMCGAAKTTQPKIVSLSSVTALLFTPHPDDECIMGALPLRLQREAGVAVSVAPVTFGSKPERRAERRTELEAACAVLGFAIADLAAQGFNDVTAETKASQHILWDGMVGKTAQLLQRLKPQMIFLPHRADAHPTHVGTHHLVMEALARLPDDFTTHLVFTEFWHPQADANLMVVSTPEDVTQLVAALMCHTGEIARNPYHRTLPAWMIDNARRGAETIGGFGATGTGLGFATLYRFGRWEQGSFNPAPGIVLPADHSAASLFALSW